MSDKVAKNVFPGARYWGGAAHRQAMPLDVSVGPRKGEVGNVLAFRCRSGATTVTVTWPVDGQVNLSSTSFEYASPREALDAGWELGAPFEKDAVFMERMGRIYRI